MHSRVAWHALVFLVHVGIAWVSGAMCLLPRYVTSEIWPGAFTVSGSIFFLNVLPLYGWVVLLGLGWAMRRLPLRAYLICLLLGMAAICSPIAEGAVNDDPLGATVSIVLAALVSGTLGWLIYKNLGVESRSA